jgi:hypothetical protein
MGAILADVVDRVDDLAQSEYILRRRCQQRTQILCARGRVEPPCLGFRHQHHWHPIVKRPNELVGLAGDDRAADQLAFTVPCGQRCPDARKGEQLAVRAADPVRRLR